MLLNNLSIILVFMLGIIIIGVASLYLLFKVCEEESKEIAEGKIPYPQDFKNEKQPNKKIGMR